MPYVTMDPGLEAVLASDTQKRGFSLVWQLLAPEEDAVDRTIKERNKKAFAEKKQRDQDFFNQLSYSIAKEHIIIIHVFIANFNVSIKEKIAELELARSALSKEKNQEELFLRSEALAAEEKKLSDVKESIDQMMKAVDQFSKLKESYPALLEEVEGQAAARKAEHWTKPLTTMAENLAKKLSDSLSLDSLPAMGNYLDEKKAELNHDIVDLLKNRSTPEEKFNRVDALREAHQLRYDELRREGKEPEQADKLAMAQVGGPRDNVALQAALRVKYWEFFKAIDGQLKKWGSEMSVEKLLGHSPFKLARMQVDKNSEEIEQYQQDFLKKIEVFNPDRAYLHEHQFAMQECVRDLAEGQKKLEAACKNNPTFKDVYSKSAAVADEAIRKKSEPEILQAPDLASRTPTLTKTPPK